MFLERLVNLHHSVKLLCDKTMKIKREVTNWEDGYAILYRNYPCLSPVVKVYESEGKRKPNRTIG